MLGKCTVERGSATEVAALRSRCAELEAECGEIALHCAVLEAEQKELAGKKLEPKEELELPCQEVPVGEKNGKPHQDPTCCSITQNSAKEAWLHQNQLLACYCSAESHAGMLASRVKHIQMTCSSREQQQLDEKHVTNYSAEPASPKSRRALELQLEECCQRPSYARCSECHSCPHEPFDWRATLQSEGLVLAQYLQQLGSKCQKQESARTAVAARMARLQELCDHLEAAGPVEGEHHACGNVQVPYSVCSMSEELKGLRAACRAMELGDTEMQGIVCGLERCCRKLEAMVAVEPQIWMQQQQQKPVQQQQVAAEDLEAIDFSDSSLGQLT